MRRTKKQILMIMTIVIAVLTMMPNTAEAASKNPLTVSVNAKKLAVKKSAQLKVKYGKKNVTKKAKYKTSSKKIATVSKYGKIVAKKTGKVTITVKYKNKTRKVKLTIVKPPVKKQQITSSVIKITADKGTHVQISDPKIVVNAMKRLTGPEALIACGNYYNSVLEKATAKGEKWVYSNSNKYVLQGGTFDQMLKGKLRGGNCGSIANWAFRDMGVISSNHGFYGDSTGSIRHYHTGTLTVKEEFDKNCIIINGDKKSFGTLMKEGKIKTGDVIIGKSHTFIYRGNGTVFASGHDAKWHTDKSVETDDPKKAVFETWVRTYQGTSNERFKVYYIIRLKNSFVPEYYRSKNGKLVKNK